MQDTRENQKLITPKGRVSFPHLFEPDTMEGSNDAKYSVTLLIPKSDKEGLSRVAAAVQAAIEDGIPAKWGGKKPAKLKLPLSDGDEIADARPEAAGCMVLKLSSSAKKPKPGIVDKNREPIDDPNDVYAGCYGRASAFMLAYDTAGSRGVTCILKHFQKLAEGEPLAGGSSAAEDFDDGVGEAEPDNGPKMTGNPDIDAMLG